MDGSQCSFASEIGLSKTCFTYALTSKITNISNSCFL
eukprot:UN04495